MPGTDPIPTGLEALPAFAAVLDENGTLLYANRAAARLLGYRASALPGKPLATFVALADRPAYRAAWAGLVTHGGESSLRLQLGRRDGRPLRCQLVLSARPDPLAPLRVQAVALPLT